MKTRSIVALLALAGCGDARMEQVWGGARSVLQSATKVEVTWLAVPDPSRNAVLPGDKPGERPPAPDMDYWHWADKSGPRTNNILHSKQIRTVATRFSSMNFRRTPGMGRQALGGPR